MHLYEIVVGNSTTTLGLREIRYVEATSGELAARFALTTVKTQYPDDAGNLRVLTVSEMDGEYIGKVEPKK